MQFVLPWPHKNLSPNARPHWSTKAKAVKGARHMAKYTALEAAGRDVAKFIETFRAGRVSVRYEFFPKDRRRRDVDNLMASTKAYTDGIADALAMDDSRFRIAAEIASETARQPFVRVRVSHD